MVRPFPSLTRWVGVTRSHARITRIQYRGAQAWIMQGFCTHRQKVLSVVLTLSPSLRWSEYASIGYMHSLTARSNCQHRTTSLRDLEYREACLVVLIGKPTWAASWSR